MSAAFDTPITRDGESLAGPFRSPRQMLADQEYDGHTSVHDEATADKLGLKGAPIEGPTHFSQFDPLAVALWGQEWFERGCISSHFENMVIEGEQVQASLTRTSANAARGKALKATGTSENPYRTGGWLLDVAAFRNLLVSGVNKLEIHL